MLPDVHALHTVLFHALRSALGLSESEANARLLRAYADVPSEEPAPSVNVCYYFLQTDTAHPILQETETSDRLSSVSSFIPGRLVLVFYGPDSETWALRCRMFFFHDGFAAPRRILRNAGIFPVPSPPPPSVVYEETGKIFRKRADLVIGLRLLDHAAYGSVISRESVAVDTIESVPSIRIHPVP